MTKYIERELLKILIKNPMSFGRIKSREINTQQHFMKVK